MRKRGIFASSQFSAVVDHLSVCVWRGGVRQDHMQYTLI